MSGVREGYPVITEADHPLWDAQEAGWPDHLPHEAWAALAAAQPKQFISSAGHPAFASGFLGNAYATRPAEADGEPVVAAPVKVRR